LQQKVIDGQENPIAVIYSNKLWDAGQKYFSFRRMSTPIAFPDEQEDFDAMPKEDQELSENFLRSGQVPAQDQPRCRRCKTQRDDEKESPSFVT